VVGISRDSVRSQKRFAEKLELPFSMACDEDGSVCKEYGASSWVGGALGLASRVSVLVDADGTVRKTYPDVSVSSHAEDVLADIEALGLGANV